MKYTHSVICLCAAVLLSCSASAQLFSGDSKKDSTLPKVEFGVKLGANFQSTSGNFWKNDYKPGFLGGINVGMHKNKVGVRIEVLLSTTSYVSSNAVDSVNIKAIYLNTPVLFEYDIIHWLTLLVGPEYSNLISAKEPNDRIQDPKLIFKGGGFSLVGGLEAKLPKHFSVGARYMLGLSNINNGNETFAPSSDSWKANTIEAYIGYSIQ